MHFQKCHSSPVRSNYCFNTYVYVCTKCSGTGCLSGLCHLRYRCCGLLMLHSLTLTLPQSELRENSCIFPLPSFPLLSECASYISRRRVLWSPASVYLSMAVCLHYRSDPDVTWGVVGMPPSCALLGGLAIDTWVALLWQHNANPSYKLACTLQYDNIVQTRNVSKCCVLAVCLVATNKGMRVVKLYSSKILHFLTGGADKHRLTFNLGEHLVDTALCKCM